MIKVYRKNLFIFIAIIILNLNLSYSVCSSEPASIEISQGPYKLGFFSPSNQIYIREDVNQYPVKIQFIFEDTDSNCFSSKDDFKIEFISNSNVIKSADLMRTALKSDGITNQTIFEFEFRPEDPLTLNSFTSSYQFKNTDLTGSGFLNFIVDNSAPIITFENLNRNKIYKKDESVSFSISISDFGSGLKSFSLFGFDNSIIKNYDTEKSDRIEISEQLSSSKILTLRYEDKLGHINQTQINLTVDDLAPTFKNSFEKIYTYQNRQRFITINNLIIDEPNLKEVTLDFSQINPRYASVVGSCSKNYENLLPTEQVCSFPQIPITLSSTQTVTLNLKVQDNYENILKTPITTEIFIDNAGPEIEDFYLENSLGVKNIFSPHDLSTKVILNFRDESLKSSVSKPILIVDFGQMPFPELVLSSSDCSFNSELGEAKCQNNLNNLVKQYIDFEGELNFKVEITDLFSNTNSQTTSLIVDGVKPQIISKKLIEISSSNDGIIKSQESFNYELIISDNNLIKNNQVFITGDFSSVSTNNDKVTPVCSQLRPENYPQFNQEVYSCIFSNIRASNGYLNSTIYFNISDAAGNYIIENDTIEVLKIGDEILEKYYISDLNLDIVGRDKISKKNNLVVINPINRKLALNTPLDIWFEGELKLKDSNDEDTFKLIAYSLINCEMVYEDGDNSQKPAILSYSLYPSQIKLYQKEGDEKFAIKIELDSTSLSAVDMKNSKLSCGLAVLKKGKNSNGEWVLYGDNFQNSEVISFTALFGYYSTPNNYLLRASAKRLQNLINDIDDETEYLDDLTSTYNSLSGVCSTLTKAVTLTSTLANAWTSIGIALASNPATAAIEPKTSGWIYSAQSWMSKMRFENKWIETTCNWVTCKQGSTITDLFLSDFNSEKGYQSISETLGEYQNSFCSAAISKVK